MKKNPQARILVYGKNRYQVCSLWNGVWATAEMLNVEPGFEIDSSGPSRTRAYDGWIMSPDASREGGSAGYERHLSERILLHHLVEKHYPAFNRQWAAGGSVLPDWVQQVFEAYLYAGTPVEK